MKKLKLILGLGFIMMLTSCATYHISTQSLLNQMADAKPEKKKLILIAPPFFIPFEVTGNSLRQITVLDKNEMQVTLKVTNRTGVRIWKKDGSKKTFYFNTLQVKDSLIIGKNDHFIGTNIKPINLNNIERIELQK